MGGESTLVLRREPLRCFRSLTHFLDLAQLHVQFNLKLFCTLLWSILLAIICKRKKRANRMACGIRTWISFLPFFGDGAISRISVRLMSDKPARRRGWYFAAESEFLVWGQQGEKKKASDRGDYWMGAGKRYAELQPPLWIHTRASLWTLLFCVKEKVVGL